MWGWQDATGDGKEAVADAGVTQDKGAETHSGLPDLEHAKSAVLNSLSSATTRRALNPDAPRDPRAGQGRA